MGYFSENAQIDYVLYAEKISQNADIIEAYNDNKLAGFLCIYLNSKIAYVTYLIVDEKFQNCGIGSALIDKAIKMAKKRGYFSIFLECSKSNIKGLNFYIKNNFKFREERDCKYLMCTDVL